MSAPAKRSINLWYPTPLRGILLLLAVLPAHANDGLLTIRNAQFTMYDSIIPPAKGIAQWQDVSLLDKWDGRREKLGLNGWYRIQVRRTAPEHSIWGIMLERLNMNAAIFFNGHPLGDGGSFKEPLGRNWNRSLYFTIPSLLWRTGNNVIHIRLKAYPGNGLLGPVLVGNTKTLAPIFQMKTTLTSGVGEALFFLTLGGGLFMLALWLRRPKDQMYLWFALASITWSLYSLNTFIRDIPVSAETWDWLVYSSTAWWTSALAMFCHRFAGINRPKLEMLFLGFVLLSTTAYALAGLEAIMRTIMIFQVGSIIIGAIAVIELATLKVDQQAKAAHQPGRLEIRLLATGIAIVLAAGIFDWMVQSDILDPKWRFSIHILHYTAPVLFIFIAWHLIGRFVHALDESEQLNAELENRIERARQTIEHHFDKIQGMEKQQAVTQERERIYRDLHDDVGAKLLSLSFRAGDRSTADLARSALQDLRDVVSRSSKDELKLEHALADWRIECSDRLEAMGSQLEWQQGELPGYTLSSSEIMNLGRILREAISNAMNHAVTRKVWIRVEYEQPELKITIDNNNCRDDPVNWVSGRGLSSIRSRAKELGGRVDWSKPSEDICRLALSTPLAGNTLKISKNDK